MYFPVALLVLALALPAARGTRVGKCSSPQAKNIPEPVETQISGCNDPPCKLQKRTDPSLEMVIRPEKDVESIVTRVHAEIVNFQVPFLGVDGLSACQDIYSEDGKTQIGCPLKAGKTYRYKTSIRVLPIYPSVNANIQWALSDGDTEAIVSCFQVKARIV